MYVFHEKSVKNFYGKFVKFFRIFSNIINHMQHFVKMVSFSDTFKGALSGLREILAAESPYRIILP